jgi:katanin p60 ATPase-containing subunit A1
MPVDLSAGVLRKLQVADHNARQHLDRGEFVEAAKLLRQCHQLSQQYADQPGLGNTVRTMRLEKAEKYLTLALQAESQAKRGDSQPTPLGALPERAAENNHQATAEGLITRVNVRWGDIGGLAATKEAIQINYALGLAQPPPGVAIQPTRRALFFGPPGTGKTMLAAAMSNELDATFFNARIPDLMSQYFGESSKILSTVYATAAVHAPSVIFLDEIDALSRQRGGGQESGAERRLLNTFLGELDGLQNKREDAPFILTVGATNVPWELDRAIISRFSGGMIYVPLPDTDARRAILDIYLNKRGHRTVFALDELVRRTQGYSGREMEQIVSLAVRRMISRANPNLLQQAGSGQDALRRYQLRAEPLTADDIAHALTSVRPAATPEMIRRYEAWQQGATE